MIGLGKNIQSNAITPSCEPHKMTWGSTMVDDEASKLKNGGTYNGTDPASELTTDGYGWERGSVNAIGTCNNVGDNISGMSNNNDGHRTLMWQCTNSSTGPLHVAKWKISGEADLQGTASNPQNDASKTYSVQCEVAATFIDATMKVRIWDYSGNVKYMSTDPSLKAGSSSASSKSVLCFSSSAGYPGSKWVKLYGQFDGNAGSSPAYITIYSISAFNQGSSKYVFVKNLYVGSKELVL